METKMEMANAIMDANPWLSEEQRNAGIKYFMNHSKDLVADKFRTIEDLRIRCEKLGFEWPAKTPKQFYEYCERIYGGGYSYEEAYALSYNRGIMLV